MPQSPSLADLQLLRLIESEGSYRGAARLLGIAHTTIQRRIKRLEQTLGIPLIQPSAGRIELTPWTARLIQQLNHQLDGVSETIKAAQSELAEATIITIDEALLDLFPVLFTALETFKYSYASLRVQPTPVADAMIQLATPPQRLNSSTDECSVTWGVFAHRTLRYDHHYATIFRPALAPLIDNLRVAQFSPVTTVATCHQVQQLIHHKQGLGLIPLSMGEMDQQLTEVSVDADRIIQRLSLVLRSDYQASSAHVDLHELLRSQLRQGL